MLPLPLWILLLFDGRFYGGKRDEAQLVPKGAWRNREMHPSSGIREQGCSGFPVTAFMDPGLRRDDG
jgi:hypothetical protein